MQTIQTINYFSNFNQFKIAVDISLMSNINALRINLSKYNFHELLNIVDIISDYTKLYPNHAHLYFDLPFPKNKTRILDFNIDNNLILKNKIYTIIKSHADPIFNQILLNATTFQYVKDTLFYGDGEGSFTVINKTENEIEVVANNTFTIKKGKSILVGLIQNSEWNSIISKLGNTFYDVTYLLSFVERSSDIINFKASLNNNSCHVIPKFETPNSINNSQEILDVSEGAFIARGDLAFTVPTDRLLNSVEKITQQVSSGKELIFATDILTSLDYQMFPNRADLFDFLYIKNLNATGIVFGGIKNFFYDKINSEIVNTLSRKTQFVKER